MLNIAMVVGLIKALAPKIDPSDIETAVSDWLTAHPEATTTVQDGSITEAKLASDVLLTLSTLESDVSDAKNAIQGIEGDITKTGFSETVEPTTGTTGKYVGSSSALTTSNAHNLSQPIALDIGETIVVNAKSITNSVAVIAQYDGAVYTALVVGGSESDTYTYTATEKIQVVISYVADKSYTCLIYKNFSDISEKTRTILVNAGIIRYIDFSQSDVGHSIRATGVYTADTNYMIPPTITLLTGETIVMAGYGYSTNFAMISAFDGTVYTPLVNSNGTDSVFSYTATKKTNIVICCNKLHIHYAYVIHNSHLFDMYANDILENQTAMNQVNFGTAVSGHYIASDGTYQNSSSFSLLTLPLYAGQIIKFKGRGYSTNTAMISEKTSPTTYTPLVLSTASEVIEYTYSCQRDMIVALSYRNDFQYEATVYTTPLDMILAEKKLSNFFGHWSLFPRLAVIGDSLSSGSTAGEGSEYGCSWLSYIARFTNATARNHYSEGGLTCSQWLTKYKTKMETDTPFNAYFIALGHNDCYSHPYDLGEITDEAGDNTFVGYYKQIIESVRSHAPYAVIFCMSLYNKSNDHDSYSEMISDICDLYTGVFFLDYANTANIYTTTGGVWSGSSHFTTIGYNYVASIVYQMVCNVVDENRDYFRTFGLHNFVGGQYDEA